MLHKKFHHVRAYIKEYGAFKGNDSLQTFEVNLKLSNYDMQ